MYVTLSLLKIKMNRKDLRSVLPLPEAASETENFQNQVLRPVLKLQHDLYLTFFLTYATRHEQEFLALSTEKKHRFVENSLQKDAALRNTLVGMTLGMLTADELEICCRNLKVYSKRIIAMLTQRLQSQL
ncbi:MAG TPA: glyoxalase [Chryseobacterium sp.]|nr:glyoxalase [Chryseobacterium sp.]